MYAQSGYDPVVVKTARKDIIGTTEENRMWKI